MADAADGRSAAVPVRWRWESDARWRNGRLDIARGRLFIRGAGISRNPAREDGWRRIGQAEDQTARVAAAGGRRWRVGGPAVRDAGGMPRMHRHETGLFCGRVKGAADGWRRGGEGAACRWRDERKAKPNKKSDNNVHDAGLWAFP